jgi:hypothetical protein
VNKTREAVNTNKSSIKLRFGTTLAGVAFAAIALAGSAHASTLRIPASVLSFDARSTLPLGVDLTPWAVPPGDEGPVESCVAWAIAYSMLGWYSRHDGKAGHPFAPMYSYSQINSGVDRGSHLQDALDLALTQGTDTQADYPQDNFDWRHKPTAAQKTNAAHWKISGYHALFVGDAQGAPGADQIKAALAGGHPVAVDVSVRHGFDALMGNDDHDAIDDDITGVARAKHVVLALGYNELGLLVENSWGTKWGNGGFGRLSWRVVHNDIDQAYTIDGFAAVAPALEGIPEAARRDPSPHWLAQG